MQFPIYAIDRDNGTGSYTRRHSFVAFSGPTNHVNAIGLVTHQDMDGGLVATIEAPEGATLVETNAGDIGLLLPGESSAISADDALAAAKGKPWHNMGLSLVEA